MGKRLGLEMEETFRDLKERERASLVPEERAAWQRKTPLWGKGLEGSEEVKLAVW